MKLLCSPEQPFNNSLWRTILKKVAEDLSHQLDTKIEVISPFGFEVLKDRTILSKKLRKFYAYIGTKELSKTGLSLTELATLYGDKLLNYLEKKQEAFFRDLIIKVYQEEFIHLKRAGYSPTEQDKLIDIQARLVQKDIYQDYADYIICCTSALYDDKDESAMFYENLRHRIRTIQLYIMVEAVFGHLIERMTPEESSLYKEAFGKIDNSLNLFINKDILLKKANQKEVAIMDDLIKPRIRKMMRSLKNTKDALTINTSCYHIPGHLSLTLSKEHYVNALSFLKKTYDELI
jgi:hypothetical protein